MLQVIRFRFLLFAGILPYLLGSAAGCWYLKSLPVIAIYQTPFPFHFQSFFLGLIGIIFALLAVQVLNENFDITIGSERVFAHTKPSPLLPLEAGAAASIVALIIGLYLVVMRGWLLLIFIAFGAFATLSYLGPPIRLSYRGLGELVIFLAYGPFMTLGAYYLQVQAVHLAPLIPALVLGFLAMALAITNEIPDYHADKLVGKRNLVVRIGRKKAAGLYAAVLAMGFATSMFGVYFGLIPTASLLILATLPLAGWGVLVAAKNYDRPKNFLPAVRAAALLYAVVSCVFIVSYLI